MRPIALDYLRIHTFSDLYENHGIKARPSADRTVVSLNYDQIAVKNGEQISNQTRGLIIRPLQLLPQDDTWDKVIVGECVVIARPFDRFYNHGDPNAAPIDWATAKAQDKLDGTMIALYYNNAKASWQVATRSVPEADLPMNEDGLTFAQLFWEGLKNTIVYDVEDFLACLKQDTTYIFELTSPLNRVVVKYDATSVTLLSARNNVTGEEYDWSKKPSLIGVPIVETHELDITDENSIHEFVKLFPPDQKEGVVVRDAAGRRVKVKSPAYLICHRIVDALRVSRRDVLLNVLDGTIDDVIPNLEPRILTHIESLQEKLVAYFRKVDGNYREWAAKAGEDRKAFALLVQESGEWHPFYYELNKKKHADANDLITSMAKAGAVKKSMLDTMLDVLDWKPVI